MSSAELARRLTSARWFRDKAKKLTRVRQLERVMLHDGVLELVRAEFEVGEPAIYVLLDAEEVCASRFLELALGVKQKARLLANDHTNSCFLFEGGIVGKLQRKLEVGPSVELEMLRALRRMRKKPSVPEPLGAFELGPATLMTFTRFIPNQGDAWARFQKSKRIHPGQARLLGKRTGELHLALARCFPTTSFGSAARNDLARAIRKSAYEVFELVPKRIPKNAGRALSKILGGIVGRGSFGKRMRIHGDLHLGQVLMTRGDFAFIDFDGEPSRSLTERREKRSPLADVAGMLRSFEYAKLDAGEPYLDAYLDIVGDTGLVPLGEELRALLNVQKLEKVLYEIRYELEHRPTWAKIPLGHLERLLAGSGEHAVEFRRPSRQRRAT